MMTFNEWMRLLEDNDGEPSSIQKTRHIIIAKIIERDGGMRCAHCGKPLAKCEVILDHKLARGLDGDDTIDNLQLSCRPCNDRKSATETRIANRRRRRKMDMEEVVRKLRRGAWRV